MGHYHYNYEEWCEDCLPVSPAEADWDDGEQDTPANCSCCGRPLDYTLTTDGVNYVIEQLCIVMSTGIDTHIIPNMGTAEEECLTYYHGMPHYEIMRDWARDLSNYFLNPEDQEIVGYFLNECNKLNSKLRK